jgi:GT2 family glycosyltransferase
MSDPIVSVVMPAYNGVPWLPETLDTLSAQTMGDFEVLVVDDVSTDDTRAMVRAWPDPRIRLIELEVNVGPVRARNRGFAEARGRYVAGLDQDDLCEPERFARQVAYLDANPDVALLATVARGLSDGKLAPMGHSPHSTPALIAWLLWIENPLVWSSVMVRTSAARQLDPVTRPEILYSEDFDLYHRISAVGKVARLDEPLVRYRHHATSASRRYTDTMRASAVQALTEAHIPVLGAPDAHTIATLLVRHNMAGEPVPDRATLMQLGEGIARLQAAFLARETPDAESRKLIRWETARRWRAIGRAGLRSGSVTLADVLAARPPHLGLGYAGVEALLWSGAIGAVRRLRRRAASA